MDYIVLDLEWNQNPYGKRNRYPEMPFEIIEVGAVRMSPSLEIEDSFHEIVKPRVYKKLHYKIKEITHFTNEELAKGSDFRKVIREFLEWCGDDYIFCTWGSMDLTELQKNMKHYKLERVLDFPLYYLDLQKIYSLRYDDGKNKSTLSDVVEELQIKEDKEFHRAIDDAYYTARIFQKMEPGRYINRFSIDTFYPPRMKEEEIYEKFDEYDKLVTREFLTKEQMFEDPDINTLKCNLCGREIRPYIDWFSDSGKTYFCLGECPEHGKVRGKIKVRKYEKDSFYAIKIVKHADDERVQKVLDKKEAIREKRREKRHRLIERELAQSAWEGYNFDDDDADED